MVEGLDLLDAVGEAAVGCGVVDGGRGLVFVLFRGVVRMRSRGLSFSYRDLFFWKFIAGCSV